MPATRLPHPIHPDPLNEANRHQRREARGDNEYGEAGEIDERERENCGGDFEAVEQSIRHTDRHEKGHGIRRAGEQAEKRRQAVGVSEAVGGSLCKGRVNEK